MKSLNFDAGQSPQETKRIELGEAGATAELRFRHNARLVIEFVRDEKNASKVVELVRGNTLSAIAKASWSEKMELAESWLERSFNKVLVPDHVVEDERGYYVIALAMELSKPEYKQ